MACHGHSRPGSLGAGQPAPELAQPSAFNGESHGGAAPEIVVRYLVTARFETFPAPPAVVDIDRATFLPAGSISMVAQPGPMAIFVDSGAITMQVVGMATVTRATVPGSAAESDPLPATGTIALRYGNQLAVPEGMSFDAVNEGSVPTVLLIARVIPLTSQLVPPFTAAASASVAWDLLADGLLSEMPPTLAVTRVVYAVGAADPVPAENFGSLLIAIEAGTIGYRATTGVSAIVRVEVSASTLVSPGTEEPLLPGDYVVDQWGAVSALRKLGDERAWVLVVTLVPASETTIPSLSVETESAIGGDAADGAR